MIDMMLQHPTITAIERTGYPAGYALTETEPHCPVCGRVPLEVFTTIEPLPDIIGCSECLGRYDADTTPEAYRDIETQETPICPKCGSECERIYYFRDARSVIAGCDQCLMAADPVDYIECLEGKTA